MATSFSQRVTGTYKPKEGEFTMTNFNEYKKDMDNWYSPSFYTPDDGYKMCLRVSIDSSRGSHLNVHVCLMPGEFDDQLKWPFRGNISIHW